MHVCEIITVNILSDIIVENYINTYINSLINVYCDLELQWGGENMTLVQASIASDGNAVILIADRLLTSKIGQDERSRYEFEWTQEKIFSIGNVGIGFAGSALLADKAETEVLKKGKAKDLDSILKTISNYIKKEKKEIIDQFILNETGIRRSNDFFTMQDLPVPEPVRGGIYTFISDLSSYLDFYCIVCGFDKNNNNRLAAINNDGKIFNITNFGHIQIGSGEAFSRIYFDLYDYKITVSLGDGLFFAYKAKKWAEAPTGVGHCTDILVLQKNKKSKMIADSSPLMNKIHTIYEEELANRKEIRNKLAKKVDNALKEVKK